MIRQIQQAKRTDYSDIKSLLYAVDLPATDITVDMLRNFLIMKQEGQISGVIGLEVRGQYGLLRSLAIHPDFQMLGYGRELLLAIEDWATNLELLHLYLLTESVPQFFKTMGYKTIDRNRVPEEIASTQQFARICGESAITFQKILITNDG